MKYFRINNLVFSVIIIMASLFTTSAYAWPEVDHMNMCGAASKSVRTYNGDFKGWNQHDRFIATNGKRYYAVTGCPNITSPTAGKSPQLKKRKIKTKKRKTSSRIKKSNKYKAFRKSVKYDEKADCARVDRLNSY